MFLATTAMDEFWDKNKKIIFLGEWCKAFIKEHGIKESTTLPYLWDGYIDTTEAYNYCNLVQKKILDSLTKALNSYHNIDKNSSYYNIILGNWLTDFIHQAYDKYKTLKFAFENHKEITTYLLDKSQYYIPITPADFLSKHISNDLYALQLYSQIILLMGKDFEKKKADLPLQTEQRFTTTTSKKSRVILQRFFYKSIYKLLKPLYKNNSIVITNTYFKSKPIQKRAMLILKSLGRIVPNEFMEDIEINFDIDFDFRKNSSSNLASDEFEKILSIMIIFNIPSIFLEGFKEFREKVLSFDFPKAKIYYSTNAIYSNYIYKFFLAEYREDIKIATHQHGGAYGIDLIVPNELYERNISDIYYTFGWEEKENTEVCSAKHLPHPMLINKSKYKNNQKKIPMFVMTTFPRYYYKIQNLYNSTLVNTKYLPAVFKFLSNIKMKILVRTYPINNWNEKNLLEKLNLKNIIIDDFLKTFEDRLTECNVCISTSSQSTYIESLAINKPTIILYNDYSVLRDGAKPYFKLLKKTNILHYSSEDAATHLNSIYDDIDAWWLSSEVQKARVEFCNHYARTSKDWASEWVAEFNKILCE